MSSNNNLGDDNSINEWQVIGQEMSNMINDSNDIWNARPRASSLNESNSEFNDRQAFDDRRLRSNTSPHGRRPIRGILSREASTSPAADIWSNEKRVRFALEPERARSRSANGPDFDGVRVDKTAAADIVDDDSLVERAGEQLSGFHIGNNTPEQYKEEIPRDYNARYREHREHRQYEPFGNNIANDLLNMFPMFRRAGTEQMNNTMQLANNMAQNFQNCSAVFLDGDPRWSSDLLPNIINNGYDSVTQIARQFRNVARKMEASYTWSGHLPKRARNKNPIYSCKVFLGGIPYDLTDSDLHVTFAKFGRISIQWPIKDAKSAAESDCKAGYVYIVFESYDNVAALLNACTVCYRDMDTGCRWYYTVSSRRIKTKEVQVIPFDIGDRFYMKGSFTGQMEHAKTVFVGALHGMLTADGLAKVMDDLFGGVIFAGLDTDKHKYPLGSGRVSFDNHDSYLKAIIAAFVEIKSARFRKRIQIDPYIENESACFVCKMPQQAAIYCRDITCLKYYCPTCWELKHSNNDTRNHRPIIKNRNLN